MEWDGDYDFSALESEMRALNLEEHSVAENKYMGWALFALASIVGELLASAALFAERSPRTLALFAATSVAMVISLKKAGSSSSELNNIPVI